MTVIDWIIIFLTGVGAVIGFKKGIIKQTASILGLIIGLIMAKILYASLAEKICPAMIESMQTARVVTFILIWVVVSLLFAVVASLLTKTFDILALGWLNRWSGALFGALKYLLIISILIGLLGAIDTDNRVISKTMKSESVLYCPMEELSAMFFPIAAETYQLIVK
jgi:membrane protein required for colicin V production